MRQSTITASAAGTTDWHPMDRNCDKETSIGVSLDGGVMTYDVEYTYVNVFDRTPVSDEAFTLISAKTAAADAQFSYPVAAVRLNVTAYTSGTATVTIIQAG